MEEKFDVLNDLGEFIGEIATREECHQRGLWHRAVYAFIMDKKGNILLQKRSANKKMWPNMWDVSVGGSVVSGESSREAAEREVAEELGLEISLENVRPAITISFKEGFDDNYVVVRDVKDEEITLQPEEVQAYKWADEAEILQMIEDGLFIPYHKGKIELLFFLRNHMGSHTK